MKFKVILLSIVSTVMLAMFVLVSGCGASEKWDTDIVSGSVYAEVEYGSEYVMPDIYAISKSGELLDATCKVVDPKGKEVDSYFGVLSINVLGDWTVTYSKKGLDDLTYKIKCVDTTAPVITIREAPSDLLKGNDYDVVVFSYEDNQGVPSDISYDLLYAKDVESAEEPVDYNKFTGRFTVDKYGWYIFRTTATDKSGNSSTLEKRLFVKNYSWVDNSLSGNMLASFDSEDYINTSSKSSINYWSSINDESWLPTWHGEDGVLKIRMNYNNTLSGQVTSKITLPIEGGLDISGVSCIRIKYRIEQECDTVQLLIAHPDRKEDIFTGIFNGVKCNIVNENDNEGYWQEIILDGALLANLTNNYVLKGFILGMSRGNVNPSLYADLYLASITKATKLNTPTNVDLNNRLLTWDGVENATGYVINVNGEDVATITGTSYTIPEGAKTVKIKATSNDENYVDSNYSTNNILPSPLNLRISSNKVLWDAVNNAKEYTVNINGVEYKTTLTSYDLPSGKSTIKVKAISGNIIYNDSNYSSVIVNGINVPDNYLADFNCSEYCYLIENGCVLYFDSKDISTEYLDSYSGKNGVVKITEEFNDAGFATFRFASAISRASNNGRLLIRMYVEGDVTGGVYLFSYNHTGVPDQITVENFNDKIVTGKWFILSLNANEYVNSSTGLIDGLQLTLFKKQNAQSNTVKVYLDEIAVATKTLSTPTNVLKNGNELTWNAVTNATGYVVKLNDEEINVTGCKYDLPTDKPYVVSVKAVSNDILFIDSEYSDSIVGGLSVPQGYLADFTSTFYEGLASIEKGTYNTEIKAQTYLTSFEGENNVLMLEVQSGADLMGVWDQNSTYALKLIKAYSEAGYTVRFATENAGSGRFGFSDADGKYLISYTNLEDKVWKTVYIKPSSLGDNLYFTWQKRPENTNNEADQFGTTFKVYFSFVKDGLDVETKDGEIASFDCDIYEGFVDIKKQSMNCVIKDQSYLTSYQGETDVLCAEIQSGADLNRTWGQYSVYSLRLPKSHGTSGYTVKFTIENASGATFGFCNSEGVFYNQFTDLTDNEWKTVYVQDLTENNVIYFEWDKACPGYTEENMLGTTFKVYFSFVKDGNAVE